MKNSITISDYQCRPSLGLTGHPERSRWEIIFTSKQYLQKSGNSVYLFYAIGL
jgi:hypothetical protein